MTHKQIKAIRARCEAASKGPWTTKGCDAFSSLEVYRSVEDEDEGEVCQNDRWWVGVAEFSSGDDAVFVAQARTDLPNALDTIETLSQALLTTLRELQTIQTTAALSGLPAKVWAGRGSVAKKALEDYEK